MAFFDTSRSTYGIDIAANRFIAAVNAVFASVVSWNDARVTRNALSGLTDRELDDIGLTRSDVDAIAQSNIIR